MSYAMLEEKLGHQWMDVALLEVALTHKSFLNENPDCGRAHNERFEFLGDAVIDLAVGHLLMEREPQSAEGDLSRRRATVVSEPTLASVASALDLGQWLFLGRGEEQSGGRAKPSVLADALEAILGAVYLDAGFGAAYGVAARLFDARIAAAGRAANEDWKTRLQEAAARRRLTVSYQLLGTTGPDHDKRFEAAVLLGDVERARGEGRSKKEAEQGAAELALAWLGELDAQVVGAATRSGATEAAAAPPGEAAAGPPGEAAAAPTSRTPGESG